MIDIIMATYNGEPYLNEQIESILKQSVQDFHIYIYDDGSSDGTLDVIQAYQKRYSDKITLSLNKEPARGAAYNFIRAMTRHKEHYVMLCDQDDVWLPDKLALSLEKMREMEALYGYHMPILLHSDLIVVNRELEIIAESYRKMMRANYKRTALHQVVSQNIVTGCTAMYNSALAELLTEIPNFLVMHDWWLLLIAGAMGRISFLQEKTVMYRQHGNNSVGAADIASFSFITRKIRNSVEIRKALDDSYRQADAFLRLYGNMIPDKQREIISRYASIPGLGKFRRMWTVLRYKHIKNGMLRMVAHLIYI